MGDKETEIPNKLWRYNLNYFFYINNPKSNLYKYAKYLILDWIEKNSDPKTESWEPYPLSKRIFNWVIWLKRNENIEAEVKYCIVHSLYLQCKRLELELEFHNLANHLLENLKALFFTSAYLLRIKKYNLNKKQLINWINISTDFLIDEIDEQFLPDGGHYERSPMYHKEMMQALSSVYSVATEILNDYEKYFSNKHLRQILQLKNITGKKLAKAKEWLYELTAPNGKIFLFGDSVEKEGLLKPKNNLEDSNKGILLKESGFFIKKQNNAYFALTANEPFPPYQPGHSHCDISSYELYINNTKCITDTGCGSYQNIEIRKHCRQTSSHNIAYIELSEQSDIWANFRIGKRAKVIEMHWSSDKNIFLLTYIDQYEQLYKREIIFYENRIRIRDRMYERRINGTFCSAIHLSPEAVIMPTNDETLLFANGKTEFKIITQANHRFATSYYYPNFGIKIQSQKIILSNHESEAIDYAITWNT